MYTYHAWIYLAESAWDYDEGGLDHKVGELRGLVTQRINTWPENPVFSANYIEVLQCSDDGDDREKGYQDLMGILDWICEHLPGSHGLVYWRDDKDPKLAKYYRVFVVARGTVTERVDPFLSLLASAT